VRISRMFWHCSHKLGIMSFFPSVIMAVGTAINRHPS